MMSWGKIRTFVDCKIPDCAVNSINVTKNISIK
jgi:hypothetical protein